MYVLFKKPQVLRIKLISPRLPDKHFPNWAISEALLLLYFYFISFQFVFILGEFRTQVLYISFPPFSFLIQHFSCSSSQTDDLSFIIFIKYLSINKHIPYWFHLVLLMCTCLCDLELYNLSMDSSLEKTDLLSPRYYWLSIVLHIGVGSCEISLIHVGMSTGFVIMHILLR